MYFFFHLFFFLNLFYLCHILFHFDDTVQPPNNGVTTLIYLTLFETFQMYVYTAKGLLQIYWISVHVTMLFTLLLGECTFKCSRFVSDVKWMVHLTDQIDFIFRIILINVDIFLHMLIIERFPTFSFIPLTSFSKLVIDTWIS